MELVLGYSYIEKMPPLHGEHLQEFWRGLARLYRWETWKLARRKTRQPKGAALDELLAKEALFLGAAMILKEGETNDLDLDIEAGFSEQPLLTAHYAMNIYHHVFCACSEKPSFSLKQLTDCITSLEHPSLREASIAARQRLVSDMPAIVDATPYIGILELSSIGDCVLFDMLSQTGLKCRRLFEECQTVQQQHVTNTQAILWEIRTEQELWIEDPVVGVKYASALHDRQKSFSRLGPRPTYRKQFAERALYAAKDELRRQAARVMGTYDEARCLVTFNGELECYDFNQQYRSMSCSQQRQFDRTLATLISAACKDSIQRASERVN